MNRKMTLVTVIAGGIAFVTSAGPGGFDKNAAERYGVKIERVGEAIVIGGDDAPSKWTKNHDFRHIFRGDLGKPKELVFGEGCAALLEPEKRLQSLYGGFPGCGSVTSITFRVKEPLVLSMPVKWSEGLHCCLFHCMKKLARLEVASAILDGTGLPEVKKGECRIIAPENDDWKAFVADPSNVEPKADGHWLTKKGNGWKIPEGYRVEFKPAERRWTYDEQSGILTEIAPKAMRPWVFPLDKNGVVGRFKSAGDRAAFDFRESAMPTNAPKVVRTAYRFSGNAKIFDVRYPEGVAGRTDEAELWIDPDLKPIRDASESCAFPIMGYAGGLAAEGEFSKYFYTDDRERTAKIFRGAGVRLVRQWNAVAQWQMGAGCGRMYRKQPGYNYEEYRTDMKNVFQFYQDFGIKVLLTLENYSVLTDPYNGVSTNDLATVKKVICDYVQWIVDNGFKDVVAGFELGNEPYFMGYNMHKPGAMTPEQYAARWTEIVDGIVKIWPGAPIGIALAEYMKGDCDFKAVRARMLAEKKIEPKSYFDESAANQWSGRYVVAMSNALPHISHVIYHAYGGSIPESCSPCGIMRFRCFTGAFPELKGKKFWITEWRERSDEDNRSHQYFNNTIFKAGYMLSMISQPDVDALNLHQFNSLSGGLYLSGLAPESAPKWHERKWPTWHTQWDSANRDRPHYDYVGKPELQVGIAGPAFRLFNEAFIRHPVILDYGSEKCGFQSDGCTGAVWQASAHYGNFNKRDLIILSARNHRKTSVVLMVINQMGVDRKVYLNPAGKWKLCGPDVRVYSCPEEFLALSELPGEGRFTKQYGYELRPIKPAPAPIVVTIPANSITTVTIPVKK